MARLGSSGMTILSIWSEGQNLSFWAENVISEFMIHTHHVILESDEGASRESLIVT